MFEGLLGSFPRRFDVWNVFLDQEIAMDAADHVRDIFNRLTAKRMKAKTAKFFFQKWLAFEEKKGYKKCVDAVKAMATRVLEDKTEVT